MASSWGVHSHMRPHLGRVTATASSRNTFCGSGPTTSICAHRLHTSMHPQPCLWCVYIGKREAVLQGHSNVCLRSALTLTRGRYPQQTGTILQYYHCIT